MIVLNQINSSLLYNVAYRYTMKSETLTVQQLFQDRRQYCVPFYQRAYVWTQQDQWSALLEDILEKVQSRLSGTKPTPHFLGAVVLEPQSKKGLLGVDSIHIIDGQQRLTTLQYVLASIRLALRATDLSSLEALISPCLKNSNGNDSNLLIVFYVQIMPDDFVMQLHRF